MHAVSIIYVFASDAVLSEMPSWVSDSQYQRVEWLNGLLGTHLFYVFWILFSFAQHGSLSQIVYSPMLLQIRFIVN